MCQVALCHYSSQLKKGTSLFCLRYGGSNTDLADLFTGLSWGEGHVHWGMFFFVFCCCEKHYDQNQLREGRVYLILQLIIKGSWGRNSRRSKSHKGKLLTGLLLARTQLTTFLMEPRHTAQGMNCRHWLGLLHDDQSRKRP